MPSKASLLDAEFRAAATGRRRGVAGGGTTADDRAQLRQLVTRKPLAAAPPTTPTSAAERRARARLVSMLKAREKHGEDSRVSAENIERQRLLVAALEAKGDHEHGAEQIAWLAEPVGIPGSTVRVVGFDRLAAPPTWLAEMIDRGEVLEAA
jgi:hypothetical protein